jgi:Rieske Fe-S protein
MSEEEQERFEDYLELEQFIERLRTQGPAHPPADLTPQQMRIYRMAMLFHSASPHVADPRPEFSAQLFQRSLEQLRAEEQSQKEEDRGAEVVPHPQSPLPVFPPTSSRGQENTPIPQPDQISSIHSESANAKKNKKRRWSRRTLFTGGTVAAASLLAGAGLDHALEPHTNNNSPNPSVPLVGNVPAKWHRVALVEELGTDAIRFTAETLVGYVIRQTDKTTDEQIVAFSAACTHMGCIVQWQEQERRFICPCHNGTFDANGSPVSIQNRPRYLTSLPRLETKIDNGNIYVKVPVPSAQSSGGW